MAAASRCAPHARRGSSGGAPGTRLYKPGPQHRASGPTGVRLAVPGGTLSCCLSLQRAESAEPERSEGPGAPGPQALLPAPDVRQRLARRPGPRPRPEPLPQVAVGAVLVVVLRLRVPEQHGWSSRPRERRAAPTQAAPTSHGHLEGRSPDAVPAGPASLWTAQGAGLAEPCPQALPPHLAGPHPRALPGSKGASGAPERPEGAARPRSPRVGLR